VPSFSWEAEHFSRNFRVAYSGVFAPDSPPLFGQTDSHLRPMPVWVKATTVRPIHDSVEAAIEVVATFAFTVGLEGIAWAIGNVSAESGKRVSDSSPMFLMASPNTLHVNARSPPNSAVSFDGMADMPGAFRFRLTPRELDHLEDCRKKNRKHDLVLRFEFRVSSIQIPLTAWDLDFESLQNPSRSKRQLRNHSGFWSA